MNEKIKTIGIFDVLTSAHNGVHRDPANYLTDLNALHRVALDVMEELFQLNSTSIIRESIKLIGRIRSALLSQPINGEYTDLVDAVYDAIVYLKQHDICQPK